MPTPIAYDDHPKANPGEPCSICSTVPPKTIVEHCHQHGWVRGYACPQCNSAMAFMDRGVRPSIASDEAILAALIAHAARCPDCAAVDPTALGDHGGRRMQLHAFACDKPTWGAAVLGAAAEGETVSAVIRRLLRERYGRVTADTLPSAAAQPASEDQP